MQFQEVHHSALLPQYTNFFWIAKFSETVPKASNAIIIVSKKFVLHYNMDSGDGTVAGTNSICECSLTFCASIFGGRQPRMRCLSVHQFSTYRWPFFRDVIKCSSFGYSALGLWDAKVEDLGWEEAADLLHEMQIRVTSYSWIGGFTGSNGCSYKQAIENGVNALYHAHLLNSPTVILYSGARNGHTRRHGLRLIKSGIEQLLPVANDLGVKLVIEPVFLRNNPWDFLGLDGYRELFDHFSADELGVVVDFFNVGHSPGWFSNLREIGDRISLVQLADRNTIDGEFCRAELGQGDLPIADWIQVLDEIGYSGDFEIELHGPKFENVCYQSVLRRSQNYLSLLPDHLSIGRLESGSQISSTGRR